MGDVSGGNGSMNIHVLSPQDWDLGNDDVSCGIFLVNSHTCSQFNKSSSFKYMDGYVENWDFSCGHGSMNSHTLNHHNELYQWLI